MDKC